MAIPPNVGAQLVVKDTHYRRPFLFFHNLGASTFNCVSMAQITALPTSVSMVLVNVTNPDDCVICEGDTDFLCGNGQDTLFMWKEGMSKAVAVASSNTSTVLADVTASAF